MKQLVTILAVLILFFTVSCVDKKDKDVEAAIDEVNAVEVQIDSLSAEVEQNAEALEDAVEELENQ